MFVKVLAVIGFVAVASAADLTVGVDGGKIIFEQNVTASPAIWRQIHNVTVNATNDEVISRVVVIDNRPGKDGEAKVVEGGEGQNNVTIELKSPAVFRGYDFSIQVFAAQDTMDKLNPQAPFAKDLNVNDAKQAPKKENGDDIILETKTSTTTSTEASQAKKDKKHEINTPALVGKEQTRLNRDTVQQKTGQSTIITPVVVSTEATKTTKADEAVQDDDDLLMIVNTNFEKNAQGKLLPTKPQEQDVKGSQEKKLKVDQTTPKTEVSSTTPKHEPTKLPENVTQDEIKHGQEKTLKADHTTPKTEASSTTVKSVSAKLPENVQTTQDLELNLKPYNQGQLHPLPIPYAKQ